MKVKTLLLSALFLLFTSFLLLVVMKVCDSYPNVCTMTESGQSLLMDMTVTNDAGVTAPKCVRPVKFPNNPVCKNKNLMNILGSLRKFCQKGKCDVESFVKHAKNIPVPDFWNLIKQQELKHSFFYCSGKENVDIQQFNSKKDDLFAGLINAVAVPENTAIFMLGKASHKGDIKRNQELSAARVNKLSELITKHLSDMGEKMSCDNIYKTYVGAEAFYYSWEKAEEGKLVNAKDKDHWKRSCNMYSDKIEDYINQSVIVFTYPCLWEMCTSLFESGKLSCDESASEELQPTEECRNLLCECSSK